MGEEVIQSRSDLKSLVILMIYETTQKEVPFEKPKKDSNLVFRFSSCYILQQPEVEED